MLKKAILMILAIFFLASCDKINTKLFKKSANNKLIDFKGFHGNKRKPLYNKKYIERAKKNVVNKNYDDSESDADLSDFDTNDESIDSSLKNRQIYQKMLDDERKKSIEKNKILSKPKKINAYPKLADANKKIQSLKPAKDSNEDLKAQIAGLRAELNETKKNMQKCSSNSRNNQEETNRTTSKNLPASQAKIITPVLKNNDNVKSSFDDPRVELQDQSKKSLTPPSANLPDTTSKDVKSQK